MSACALKLVVAIKIYRDLRSRDLAMKFIAEYADFYRTKRGFHPRAVNSNPQGSWATTVPLAFINMPILQRAAELKAPALLVHGENAHSRYFSEDAFKSLGSEDKELFIIKGASHTDLYDNTAGKIPFDKFGFSLYAVYSIEQACFLVKGR